MNVKEIDLLVAEDDPRDAALVLEAIRQTGSNATIFLAQDGVETLDLLHGSDGIDHRVHPRALLLDLKMPLVDGLGVIRAVRAHPSTSWLPIIVCTSSGLPSDVEACYRSGANGYVVKPIAFDELARQVRTILAYWVDMNQAPALL